MKKYSVLIVVIAFAACHQQENKQADKPAPVAKRWELGEVVEKPLSSSINLPGELRPFEIVQLYPKVNGFVKEVSVDRGSLVHKGQVLLRLEAPEIEQQYFAAKSKYLQVYAMFLASKDSYERLVVTSRTPGTVPAHDLEMARTKMMADSAMSEGEIANYRGLEATKNYLTVQAPFNGVITERNVHPGALVGPNIKADDKPMLVLEEEARLRLVVNIPEVYSNQLQGRSAISFMVSTLPGKIFTGNISRSSGSLNTKFRSEAVEIDVNNAQHLLKPGMYAEVILPIERSQPSMVVPSPAVVTSTEGKYVICVMGGKATRVDVLEGNSRNDSTEVFGHLHTGDKVVLHATDEIKDGTKIGG
jgi:membrane fusion protein (multidrug efflux system)